MGNKSGQYTVTCSCDDGDYFFNDTYIKKVL